MLTLLGTTTVCLVVSRCESVMDAPAGAFR